MKKLIAAAVALVLLGALAYVAFSAETNAPAASSRTTSTNEPTIVTSDHLSVDYAHNFGTFEGNVLAVDPHITVRSDKMTVWFGSTNNIVGDITNAVRTLQKIFAEGSVVITTPDEKVSHSDFALYTADDGKTVLTGSPRVHTPESNVTGKKITFWRSSSKMDVESDQTDTNRTRLIIYPEDEHKKADEPPKPKAPAP
jgi:lipopolysaccharide transport protein LptA